MLFNFNTSGKPCPVSPFVESFSRQVVKSFTLRMFRKLDALIVSGVYSFEGSLLRYCSKRESLMGKQSGTWEIDFLPNLASCPWFGYSLDMFV